MASPNTDVAEKMTLMKKRFENLTARGKEAEEQREKTDQDMNKTQQEREELERRLKEHEERRGLEGQRGMQQHTIHSTPVGAYNRPPKFPSSATKVSHWQHRMTLFLGGQGLGYTIRHSPCLLYTSPSPRDLSTSRMPSSA